MSDNDKVKMNIHIGGTHLQLISDFDKQEDVREAEKAASTLFSQWRARWPHRSDEEILAMVAYKFSAFYHEELKKEAQSAKLASGTRERLSDVLRRMRDAESNGGQFKASEVEAAEFEYPD